MGIDKKIDLKHVSDKRKRVVDKNNPAYNINKEGIYGDERIEPDPHRVMAPCEIVHKGKNNNYIVFGRDRPGQRNTGYAATGDTHASMIDIVVGMQAYDAKDDTFIDPDFQKDAARIYISQKTDIDENFLLNGVVSEATSAVGIHADNVRIASREYVKITAGTSDSNSKGQSIDGSLFGIHLVANNDVNDLQSMPKGENLARALKRIVAHVHNLHAIVERMLKDQDRFNKALTNHVHVTPFFGMLTEESPECLLHGQLTTWYHTSITKKDLRLSRTNLENFRKSYLEHGGKYYINSYYNKVN